jgi:hypothetical protein
LYTLRLNGSFPWAVTFLFDRYFASKLKGCLAPLISRSVIINVGPALSVSFGRGAGKSVESTPMAVECARFERGDDAEGGGGGGEEEAWCLEASIAVDVRF